MGSQVERTCGKVEAGGPGQAKQQLADQAVPHLHADKPAGTAGEQDKLHNPGFQHGEIKPQNL